MYRPVCIQAEKWLGQVHITQQVRRKGSRYGGVGGGSVKGGYGSTGAVGPGGSRGYGGVRGDGPQTSVTEDKVRHSICLLLRSINYE